MSIEETPNLPGRKSAAAPPQAWFDDEASGYHVELKLDGQTFWIRELGEAQLKAFGAASRRVARALQELVAEQKRAQQAAQQIAEEAPQAENDESEGAVEPAPTSSVLSDEAMQDFAQRSDDLLAQQFANYDAFLLAALVKWSLPRELNADAIAHLSKSARRRLAELVGQSSTLGAEEQASLPARSRR